MYIRVNTILEVKGASGAGNVECVKVLNPYNKSRAGGFILARVLLGFARRDKTDTIKASPIFANLFLKPPSTLRHFTSFAPELSVTFKIVCC